MTNGPGVSMADLYWLAGLLEGEGSFQFHCAAEERRAGRDGYACIVLSMVDKDVVERAGRILKRKVCGPYGPYGISKQSSYVVTILNHRAASWMMTLYPLMGQRRKAQIRPLLAAWRKR